MANDAANHEAFIELNDLLQNPELEIDLNMAVEEDLGDIDNLAQGIPQVEELE